MATAISPEGGGLIEQLWARYFPGCDPSSSDRRYELAEALQKYFLSNSGFELLTPLSPEDDHRRLALPMDHDLMRSRVAIPDLWAALQVAPDEALSCLCLAAHAVALLSNRGRSELPSLHPPPEDALVTVRLFNHSESLTPFASIRSNCIGRMVSVKGAVVRATAVKPLPTEVALHCLKCGGTFTHKLRDGVYSAPKSCGASPRCKAQKFKPLMQQSPCRDWQRVRLQENQAGKGSEEGRIPRMVECELSDGLVDSCKAGDIVTVLGIVKVMSQAADLGGGGGQPGSQLMSQYIEAVSVTKNKQEGGVDSESEAASRKRSSSSGLSARDIDFVSKFGSEYKEDHLRQLVHSLAPSISGHTMVKAGMILALCGGMQKNSESKSRVPIRGNTHMLLVGEPGIGKSQLLKAVAGVAPRGLYVCGNVSSSVGLTVSVQKDSVSGEYSFEAGAAVMADRGACCIDEFDKMPNGEQSGLLEVMEQQSVSVSKAGLTANLPARTTVMAAANPAKGTYDKAKSVTENLRMGAALLSRFDLAFIMLDKPDEDFDTRASARILAQYAGKQSDAGVREKLLEHSSVMSQGAAGLSRSGAQGEEAEPSLQQRLQYGCGKDFDPIPSQLIQKYITYVRHFVHPKLTREASKELKDFYLKLRKRESHADATPVTARQLESLVRLAEARARVEMRECVTKQDAADVVELMNESLFDKSMDARGFADLTNVDDKRKGGGGKKKEAERLLTMLKCEAESSGERCFTRTQIQQTASRVGITTERCDAQWHEMKQKRQDASSAEKQQKRASKMQALGNSNWKAVKSAVSSGRKKRGEQEQKATQPAGLTSRSSETGRTSVVGLDCEMVGVGPGGRRSALARISIVNSAGNALLDTFVAPKERVTDYRTSVSGVTQENLKDAPYLETVRDEVEELLRGRTVVGHALRNDFRAMMVSHPGRDVRDTAKFGRFVRQAPGAHFSGSARNTKPKKLSELAKHYLGVSIQSGSHSSLEDARAALYLYLDHQREWERKLRLKNVEKSLTLPRARFSSEIFRKGVDAIANEHGKNASNEEGGRNKRKRKR